jgi:uncharacterized membrane protein
MTQSPLMIQLILFVVPLYALGMLLPEFTRKTLFFGVTLPPEVQLEPILQQEKKNYRIRFTVLFTIGWLLIMVLSRFSDNIDLLYGGGVMAAVLVLSSNYVITHKRIKTLKETHGWTRNLKQRVVVDTGRESSTHFLSNGWFAVPAFISLLTWILTASVYPHLPAELPQRAGYGDEVLDWVPKSFSSAFALPLTQLGMVALFFFIMIVLKRARKIIDPSRPEVSIRQHQAANRRWSAYLIATAAWIVTYYAILQVQLLQMIQLSTTSYYVLHGVSVAGPLLGIFIVAWTTGQSAGRVKTDDDLAAESGLMPVDDDRYWKWGLLYYNPDDPAVWIEKRFGIGWTLNFGNPVAVGLFVVLLLVIAAGIIF